MKKIDCIELTKKLISFPSVTPEPAGAFDYIKDLLEPCGFNIVFKDFGEGLDKVHNLYARIGDQSPNICFAGHIDIVPPGDLSRWSFDPYIATEHEGYLYGRGVVDMKGAIACMIASSINFLQDNKNFNGSISFLLTSDEEGPATNGTKLMLEYIESLGEKIDLAIVGEPTLDQTVGDTIHIGRRGSISFELNVIGKQGHVAYQDEAINPNHILVKLFNDLINTKLDSGNDWFEPSNLEITSIDACNNIENLIPNSCKAKFNIRYNNLHSKNDLVDKIENIIKTHSSNYELKHRHNAEPFICDPEDLAHKFAISSYQVTNIKPKFSTAGGTSDARFIKNYTKTIEFGLSPKTAHQIDERATITDLHKLYDIYYQSLQTYLLQK
jgi:succinyl-diaminopimelate desuccinylase